MPFLFSGQFFDGSGGAGGGGGGDPHIANVVLLLGFEGSDGSTTLTDESPAAHGSATANGNAQIDTAQFKFGTSSGLFDGTGDYFSWADSADWRLSAANSDLFTIEFWLRPHANVANQRIMGQAPASGNTAWYINSTFTSAPVSSLSFNYSSNGSLGGNVTTIGNGGTAMALDAWHFIAISKNASGKIRLWVNGALDGSATPADSSMFNSTGALEIGRAIATSNLNGHLDELRITKGVCRYDTDSAITVPTAAFPRS